MTDQHTHTHTHTHLLVAEGQVGVGVEAEDLGRVHVGEEADVGVILVQLQVVRHDVLEVVGRLGHGLLRVEREGGLQGGRGQPRLGVGVEEPPVQVVRDLAAVLHLAHHVLRAKTRTGRKERRGGSGRGSGWRAGNDPRDSGNNKPWHGINTRTCRVGQERFPP
jgi:hypothetical protein